MLDSQPGARGHLPVIGGVVAPPPDVAGQHEPESKTAIGEDALHLHVTVVAALADHRAVG